MRARHGFTLLEVLIAVAIVAMLSLLGYRALAAMSESEARLAAEADRWHALDALFARLEGDLREAVPRDVRVDASREPAWLATVDANGNSTLTFSRAGPELALEASSAGQRLQYGLRDGVIQLAYWPGYDRLRATAPTVYPLLSDVARFRMTYMASSGAWAETWPLANDTSLPAAAHVELTLANGETLDRWLALR